MKETHFKVLMHSGQYVDMSRLNGGIYPHHLPCTFQKDETIESLMKKGDEILLGSIFDINNYFENLKKCELVDIEIFMKIDKDNIMNNMKKKENYIQTISCDKCGRTAKTTEPDHEKVFTSLGYTHHPDVKKLKDLCVTCSPKRK